MTPCDHGPEDGPHTNGTETPARRPRGADPLSAASRRKLLAVLQRAAHAGDAYAAAVLIELGLTAAAERDAQIGALRRLRAGKDGT